MVRDKRRIDPTTGEVRPESQVPPVPPAAAAGTGGASGEDVGSPVADAPAPGAPELEAALAERTADLQRLSAEYANYRRRMDRERGLDRERVTISVLAELLSVLDNVERARAHGELVGGFKVVAESLEATLAKLGLVPFGEAGDAFDPNQHEALMHETSPDVTESTCVEVLQSGYKVGETLVRPARVKVLAPE